MLNASFFLFHEFNNYFKENGLFFFFLAEYWEGIKHQLGNRGDTFVQMRFPLVLTGIDGISVVCAVNSSVSFNDSVWH